MNFPLSGEWPEERISRLKELFEQKLSGSQIAAQLGVTRNSVIGKLHRMRLSLEKARLPDEERFEREKARTKVKAARNKERRQYSRTIKAMQDPITPPPEIEGRLNIPYRDLRDFSHLGPNQCRYIADEPPGPDYLACGIQTPDGASYCAHCGPLTFAKNLNSNEGKVVAFRRAA